MRRTSIPSFFFFYPLRPQGSIGHVLQLSFFNYFVFAVQLRDEAEHLCGRGLFFLFFSFASGVAPPSFSVPLSVPPSLLVVACVWFRLLVVLLVVVVFRFWLGLGISGSFPRS